MNSPRLYVAALALSAAAFGSLVMSEGWSPVAEPPVKGDVPTYGFGTTTKEDGSPLNGGEVITPPKAVSRILLDVQKYEGAVRQCITVPLTQNEYDSFVLLSYNIGTKAFCQSTLAKKANSGDNEGACREILRWDRFKGQPLRGLTLRREREYKLCMGE